MLSPSNRAGSSSSSSSGNARRRRRPAAKPRAPPASASATALAACLAALILNATGDSPALASAFVVGGAGSSRPAACFRHAATAAAADSRTSIRTRTRLGGNCGANSLPGAAAGAEAARAATDHDGDVSSARRRACRSQLGAWRSGCGGEIPVRAGGTRLEAASARAEGYGRGGDSKDRGLGRLDMMAVERQGRGGGGDTVGIRAAGQMEAATVSSGGGDVVDEGRLQDLDLGKMKLSELKLLYREGGGKPGNLRKAELVERLRERPLPPGLVVSAEEAGASASPTPLATDKTAAATGEPPVAMRLESPPRGASDVASLPPREEVEEESAGTEDLGSVLNGGGKSTDPAAHQAPPGEQEHLVPDAPPARPGDDLLSSGPSAVVAAARARGAAAAAASSKTAASGRLRAMTEARLHAEAVRAKASNNGSNGWVQSAEPGQHEQHQPQTAGKGAFATTATLDDSGSSGVREGGTGAGGLEGLHKGVTAAPGAAAVAAVVAADAARAAATAAAAATANSSRTGRSGKGKSDSRQEAGAGARGRGAGRGADGGSWSVLVESPVARRSPSQPRRRLPMAHNPWARGGVGGEEEGMPEEGDVVDAFLADTMMRPSDDRQASGDSLFERQGRFGVLPGAPMQLTFLGTASCIPSTSRGVSCTVLRNEGDLWLFDVGEGTQIQIQKSSLRPTRITKIFITHAHGDHSFGLPGLLCLMGTNFDRADSRRVEIYGPTGLRAYLRAAIQYTYSKSVCPYVVHELCDVPYLHGDFFQQPEPFHVNIARDNKYGEQHGGRNYYPDKNGVYELFQDGKVTVRAAPLKHGVPCVGFSVEEADRPGRLLAEKLNPILQEHKEAISETTGRKDVGWVLGWIKSTKRGERITLPGTDVTINSADYVGASVKGRKVVVLGDTCDAGSMVPLAMGADVVVHEATNTFLPPLDQGKTYADVETEAIKHGHSTPVMAAAFAEKVGAKTLILNHFSARYRGDPSDASVAAMMRIERQAARAGGFEPHQVVASWDLLELPVVDEDQWEANRAAAREADAAFDAELRRRAQRWQEGSGGGPSSSSATAAGKAGSGAAPPPPPRAYEHEHEHSKDFLDGTEAGAVAAVAAAADDARPLGQGADAGAGGGETKANGSAAPANTGLVGIMFDAMV